MASFVSFWCRFLGAYLEIVEAFAIDADDSTLRDKGMRIYLVDDAEYQVALPTLCQYEEHLDLLARIKALSIDDGTATMRLAVDAIAYLLVFVRDDEELYRAAGRFHNLVYTEGRDPSIQYRALNLDWRLVS